MIKEKRGLILMVGATGTGKSTTLASMLELRNQTLTGHILFIGTVAGIIGCVLMIRDRQALPVLAYGIATVALAAISQPVGLRPRFLMLAFPIVIALATRYSGRTYRVLVAASAVLLALLSVYEISSRAVFP
jgi:energy-coupling factor transporter ATP-binding protein EcfA2